MQGSVNKDKPALLGVERESLKEVVIGMLQAKSGWSKPLLLKEEFILEKAMKYYSEHGDFSVEVVAGDGVESGGEFYHIGGNINDFLLVDPLKDANGRSLESPM